MSRMDGGSNPANHVLEENNLGPERPQRRRRMANEDHENSPEYHANNLGGPSNGPR